MRRTPETPEIDLTFDKTLFTQGHLLRRIVTSDGRRTVTEAAKLLGVGRKRLYTILNDKDDLSLWMAVQIEAVFGYSAIALLQYQVARKVADYHKQNNR